ncbi:MAG: carboxypeptidase regulatory-like domain-containing protein [Candidatus Anammoxibacter sp.]
MKQNVLNRTIYISLFFSVFVFTLITDTNAEDGKGNIFGHVTTYGQRGAPNTLVFIEDLTGDFAPPEEHAVIELVNSEFVPRMKAILKGTIVDFVNTDAWHNVYSPEQSVTPFNLGTFPPGRTRSMKFENVGVAPITDFMHSEMRTYVIALGNPYFSTTDKTGRYEIKDVPTGTYSLRVWNEKRHADTQKITVVNGRVNSLDFVLE